MTLASFFRNRWWIVFASVLGLIVGAGSINVFAIGVRAPLSETAGDALSAQGALCLRRFWPVAADLGRSIGPQGPAIEQAQ